LPVELPLEPPLPVELPLEPPDADELPEPPDADELPEPPDADEPPVELPEDPPFDPSSSSPLSLQATPAVATTRDDNAAKRRRLTRCCMGNLSLLEL
jgi:hypothetical protein